jgi:hypothetical protein
VITTNGTYPLSLVTQIYEMLCVRGVEVDRKVGASYLRGPESGGSFLTGPESGGSFLRGPESGGSFMRGTES